MQNLQLHEPSMNHSKNPTTSNTPQSRPPLPEGGVSPPIVATPTARNYVSPSTSLSSRTASAACYNPMVYRRRETKPPNVTDAPPASFYAENSAARHHSSPPNRFLSSTRSMEEAQQLLRPPRGVSSQRGGSKSRVCVVCQRTQIEIGQRLCDTCEYYRKY